MVAGRNCPSLGLLEISILPILTVLYYRLFEFFVILCVDRKKRGFIRFGQIFLRRLGLSEMKFEKVILKKRWAPPVLTLLAPDDDRVRDAAFENSLIGEAMRKLTAKV